VKIVALLNFFDEKPSWLAATVASCALFCDHLVASDGGYFLFPGARSHSGPAAHEAISETAYASGIGCTIHAPSDVWYGNEVEKRNHLVQLGMTIVEPGDWFFRIDADEVVTDVPEDVRERLERTDMNVGGVTLWWRSTLAGSGASDEVMREVDAEGSQQQMRFLLRALPGLRVEGAHNFYVTDDKVLYGRADMHDQLPLEDFHDLRVEHRHHERLRIRNERADEFNRRRDSLGIERVWETRVESVDRGRVEVA
jgi:hypothetical protein